MFMNRFRVSTRCKFGLAVLLFWSQWLPAADRIPLESVVIFNTSCARCHEGEYSHGLSFCLPEDAADGHIRRYGGELSRGAVRQLAEFAALHEG